jgi:hypothetical protein
MRCSAAIVVILKSILKSSDLKTTTLIAIATLRWRQQSMGGVELDCMFCAEFGASVQFHLMFVLSDKHA